MAPNSALLKVWSQSWRQACRDRGMQWVSDTGFDIDEVYLSMVWSTVTHPDRDESRLRISWQIQIKPMALDEVLWAAFLPDVQMGPRMRINRRISGAFQIQPIDLGKGSYEVAAGAEPSWQQIFDEYDRVRGEFVASYPSIAEFANLAKEKYASGRSVDLVRWLTALIAAGRHAEAANLADEALSRGERGPMASVVDVLKYLAAYAHGPQAHAELLASLVPTHDFDVLKETERGLSMPLRRQHSTPHFERYLADFDGSDPWAVVLTVRPQPGQPDDHTTSCYLQAAGNASEMAVEICTPGGAEYGVGSVRSVVGREGGKTNLTKEITLPRMTLQLSESEIFTAEEAAILFEHFYRNSELPHGYVLRPVEGFSAAGAHLVG